MKLLNFRQDLVFVVPSGNLGNLTAGIFASKFSDFNCKFIAAHNANSTFPDYLKTANFQARDSIATISNAMDVGAPSNFERLQSYFGSDVEKIRKQVSGVFVSDDSTLEEMKNTYVECKYVACPHTAVALRAARKAVGYKVVLSTADPKKFSEVLVMAGLPFDDTHIKEAILPPSFTIGPKIEELISILD